MSLTVEDIAIPAQTMRDVVALRRDIHAHPELGFEEVRTAGIVGERLTALGYAVRSSIGETGVVGILRTGKPGLTILLRADMDALPIQEESGLPFASTVPGKMHACGHDGHVAILLGAAQIIMQRRDLLCGTIVLCFQPAEEGKGGAKAMIADGMLDDPHVDRVYGLHLWTQSLSGRVLVAPGPIMASSDSIEIIVRGRGGHGAGPHHTVDPILTTAHFITQVQSIVSRAIDPVEPAVITIGAIHGGTTHNVIPDSVRLLGTVRAFNTEVRDAMKPRIEMVLRGCCEAHGATYEYEYLRRYDVTRNDSNEAEFIAQLAQRMVGAERCAPFVPIMGAEDFSFMLAQRPGCFFFVGAGASSADGAPHHSPRFVIDEPALETGVKMMVALAFEAPRRLPGVGA